jgi:hypothetical protein
MRQQQLSSRHKSCPSLLRIVGECFPLRRPSLGLSDILSDTKVLLCSTKGGEAFPMTENHHADGVTESIRLRRMMGAALIRDSFGESR